MLTHDFAEMLLKDFDNRTPSASFGLPNLELSIEQCYEVQYAIASLRKQRGEQIVGYKIGCTSDTVQRQMGITHPIFGRVWNTEKHESGCKLAISMFDHLAIEGELAVTIEEDIPCSSWLTDNPEVMRDMRPVIELHNKIFYASAEKRAGELIANNAIHAGIVCSSNPISSDAANNIFNLKVFRNDELIGETLIDHFKSRIVRAVAQLVDHLALYGERLLRDHIVLTGSMLPLWNVGSQDIITVTGGGADRICCFFEGSRSHNQLSSQTGG